MRKYVKDFKVVIEEDEKGRERRSAVYAGKYFDVSLDETELKKFRRISIILLVLIIAAHFAGGSVANQGMYAFYVAVPYVIAFLPLYFMTTGILRMPKTKRKYRRDEVELTFKRIKKSSIALFVLLCLGVVGEIIYLIWFTEGNNLLEWIYLAVEVITAAIAYIQIHVQRPVKVIPLVETQEEPEPSEAA